MWKKYLTIVLILFIIAFALSLMYDPFREKVKCTLVSCEEEEEEVEEEEEEEEEEGEEEGEEEEEEEEEEEGEEVNKKLYLRSTRKVGKECGGVYKQIVGTNEYKKLGGGSTRILRHRKVFGKVQPDKYKCFTLGGKWLGLNSYVNHPIYSHKPF